MLQLQSVTERTRLVDPAGREMEQVIEHRVDPLTSTVASINTVLGEKAKAFLGTADVEGLRALQEKSREGCPFCAAQQKGTRFVADFAPEGQIAVGRSLAVPNLFSKYSVDAVVIIDHTQHVLFPSQLTAESLASAIRAAVEVVRRARAREPALVHHVLGMNFLHPGGSSVPHPHFQAHVRTLPYSALARWQALSAAWLEREGQSYWDALVEHERAAHERWVGESGRVQWLAAWAPAHQKEIWGVLPGVASLASLADADADAFAAGIARVVSFYEESGNHPFTLVFCPAPHEEASRSWALQVRLCARPAFRPLYSNYDSWFTPKLLGEDVHTEAPEAYAARLRARW